MSLEIKNTKELINPEKLFLKMLVYGLPGTGKTKFLGTVPDIGVAACEQGHGKGLLTIAELGIDYITPENMSEMDAFVAGNVFGEKTALGLDSLSGLTTTFIKADALSIPRQKGETAKRKRGVPELDDYGTMGELTFRFLERFINIPNKHIIVTATEKHKDPDPETGQGETIIGPELAGRMFAGSTAMFDVVMRLRTRPVLKDPRDAKTRYTQRYFITQPDGQGSIVKCRLNSKGAPVFDKEEVFDPDNGIGTFPALLEKVKKAYAQEATT